MSTRAIAPVVGVGVSTVKRDVQQVAHVGHLPKATAGRGGHMSHLLSTSPDPTYSTAPGRRYRPGAVVCLRLDAASSAGTVRGCAVDPSRERLAACLGSCYDGLLVVHVRRSHRAFDSFDCTG